MIAFECVCVCVCVCVCAGLQHAFISIPGAGHVPQMQLINDTDPATGVRYLELAIAFFIETMDLKHAECPTKVSPAAP